MRKNLRHVIVVSVSTLGSRLLGLTRDILMFAVLGASVFNSAFLVAFTLPNLFRRLLGEGALTSALVPLFSEQLEQRDRKSGFRFLNRVLTRLAATLGLLTLAGMAIAWGMRWVPGLPERWYLVAELTLLLLPYMIFICLGAILGAALNVLSRFMIPALSPVWLNLCMILALAVPPLFIDAGPELWTVYLSIGVLAGGVLQAIVPGWALRREGWRPVVDRSGDEAITNLWHLLLPGLAGAAVLQVNILVSRLIAFLLDDAAVAILYLAGRLMELPLGVFTIAVVTVYFPTMARQFATGNLRMMGESFGEGTRMILAITLPAAAGLVVLGRPILEALFNWGEFDSGSVTTTVPVLAIYAIGLPFYSVVTLAIRAFHARKDMSTPLRIAVWSLVVNVVLSVALMFPFRVAGLALANVLAAGFQSVLLIRALGQAEGEMRLPLRWLIPDLVRILVASVGMALLCLGGRWLITTWIIDVKLASFAAIAILVPAGALTYFLLLHAFRFQGLGDLLRLFRMAKPGRSFETVKKQ